MSIAVSSFSIQCGHRALQLQLHVQKNSQRETDQKAEAGDAETQGSHFGKALLEGLIHSHGYVKVEQPNDEDGCQERACQRHVIVVEDEIGSDQKNDSRDIGRPGLQRGFQRLLAGSFGLGRKVFRCGHR
jgi:hypothetical protein